MKEITEYINESSLRHLDADEITGPLTPGVDFSGDICVIIGKPFTNDRDEAYLVTKEFIKKLGYKNITMDLKDVYNKIPEAEDAEYFVFATDDQGVSCFTYNDAGVVGIR